MRLPKQVKVGGHNLRIEAAELSDFGDYDREQGIIRINKGTAEDQKRATLLHEILHAVFAEAGLTNKYKSSSEEEIIQAMEPLLFQTLCDNPQLVRYISRCHLRK